MSSKATRSGFGRRRSGGTITVIETRVHQHTARNAKLAFWVTGLAALLLSATVLADRIHPILALFAGALIGAVFGAVVWTAVRVWPVARMVWWWLPEILLALAVVYGFLALCRTTPVLVRLLVLGALVGALAGVPMARRTLLALAWCLVVRHRLRTCFAQFIIANQSGTLPLILVAKPTPVGERVWVYLRTGLSIGDLESRLDKLAVACHASTVTVTRASGRTAALAQVDIKRREVLDRMVDSHLVDLVDPDTPATVRDTTEVPTALDLPDIPADAPAKPATSGGANGRRPSPRPRPAEVPPLAVVGEPAASSPDGENVSDWI